MKLNVYGVINLNIEDEIFKRAYVDFDKLCDYGFKKDNNGYVLEKIFLNNEFKTVININNKGIVSGKVIDLQMDEEYLGFRTNIEGEFVNSVRNFYRDILIDIRNKCFDINYFISNQANRISKYIKSKYGDDPEFLWEKFPLYAVFRNNSNNKWYGIIMNIDRSKFYDGNGEVEIINVKLDVKKIQELLKRKGFYNGYHMNKNWISIVLDDSLLDEEIISLLDESYDLICYNKNR